MSGVWGNRIKLSIFGESHGKAVGINIDGIPAGTKLDMDYIKEEMAKRAPGRNELSTPRMEDDRFEILSGFFKGRTTGTPLCAVIYNSDQHSKDYEEDKDLMRPSHADFTGFIKYKGFNDYRGGGHFSGRLTAPLVFAGAVCRQILKSSGIIIGSHIKRIGNIEDKSFNMADVKTETIELLNTSDFPLLNKDAEQAMKKTVMEAKEDNDSVGGIIETAVINLPAGLGEPFFDSVESILSHLLFSIPAVKGVEFGAGFEMSTMRGSEANDEFYMEGNKVKSYTNNNGGINGGITNGMPLIFRVVVKPTPSIAKKQRTINIVKKEDAVLSIKGRHDPCIVPRALPVVEAAAAIGILDLYFGELIANNK